MKETISSISLTFPTTNDTMLDAYLVLNNYLINIPFCILLYNSSNRNIVMLIFIISLAVKFEEKINVSCLIFLERSGK